MIPRPQAIFDTTIPDDSLQDERDIIVFPGRIITETLVLGLRAKGYETTAPEHVGFKGWVLGVYSKRNLLIVHVSVVDEVYVSVEYRADYRDRWLGRKDELYRPLLRDLDAILRGDARFSNIRWMALGAEGPAFEHPID